MFDTQISEIELSEPEVLSGESEDRLAYMVTVDEMATGWSESERHLLPPDLESIPTGLHLAAILGAIDRTRLNGHDTVRLLGAEARLEAAATSRKLATVAEIAHCPPSHPHSAVERVEDVVDYASAEVAAALTLTRRAADALMERALWLETGGRRVLNLLNRGEISQAKADVFQRALSHLDPETVERVLDETLGKASELTTGQLAHRVSRLVMTSDPDGAKSSMQEGLEERRIAGHANPDFTGCVHICSIHPVEISAALRHVDGVARRIKIAGDLRSLDQLRADVSLALLRGLDPEAGEPENLGGSVHLTVPLAVLADLSDVPGDLAGYAPVIADIARQIALRQVDGEWTWSVTRHGEVIATGTTRYRPTVAQKRKARADYPTCVHPGCRMPTYDCDLDHRHPFSQGGRTHNGNLAPLCRYHHMMRHHTPWEYERLPNGDHRWTSPLGHHYLRPRDPPEEAV